MLAFHSGFGNFWISHAGTDAERGRGANATIPDMGSLNLLNENTAWNIVLMFVTKPENAAI